jgi:signal transduction histidine kinase/CheY-like chemotaxis protein
MARVVEYSRDRARLPRALLAVLAVAALISLIWWQLASAPLGDLASQGVTTLTDARFCRLDGMHDAIPGADCGWKPAPLPKQWRPAGRRMGDAWFKAAFQLATVPEGGLALYATTFNRTGRVFVNGQRVREIGAMVYPLPLNWNRSQFVVVPAVMLRPGPNEIEIQQRQYADEEAYLSALRLGPEAGLRPVWERRVFLQNELPEILGAITGTIGFVMIGVWLFRRSEASYFWFGCTCLVWTLSAMDYFLRVEPLPTDVWGRFAFGANVLSAVCLCMFVLRYCGRRQKRVEAAIWAYFIAGATALATTSPSETWLSLWFLGTLVSTQYFAFLLVRQGLRRNLFEGAALCVAAVTDTVLSWHDAWLFAIDVPEPFFLAHYGKPLYVVVIGVSLIRHFAASLTGIEKQNALTLRALDDAQQATKDKNLFFSMVSHELKSPLQSIITVLATEDKRAAGRERREALKKIQWAVRYMEAQIRDLFVLSVGEAGKLEMRSEPFEVGELVDEVVASVSALAAGKSLALEVHRPDDFLFVATDPKRIEQVLLNLVENAVKYTAAGSVSIDYGLETPTLLRITVSDTGIGIPREYIDKLFVPYRRFALLDREHNSLGIGLAVVQTLMTHLGGECSVQSTPQVGSTFTVRVPVAVVHDDTPEESSQETLRVLIVDDRPDMLANLKEVAQTLGYHVETAGSAPQASNNLAVSHYDVVLIDLDMPVKNGRELASEIRRSDGPNNGTCLVAISAGGLTAQDDPGMWPFDSFEQKPIDARSMKRIVETRASGPR